MRPNCTSYTDLRLASVYDALNPPGREDALYLELAGSSPIAVLDVGCGTGRLACRLAANGHRVTGADPAAAMLRMARSRPGGDGVRWIEAAAGDLAVAGRFDLIIMTGHVFQVFLDDSDVHAALAALRRHLADGGRLAFETRNPVVREWETWRPDETLEHVTLADGARVDVHYDIAAVEGEHITFETHFAFSGKPAVVTATTLRFMDQPTVAAHLDAAGFGRVKWLGDWDGSPFADDSPEVIAIAEAR